MRVLWITNGPIALHCQQLGIDSFQSGGWMDAAFESIKAFPELQMGLASVHNCSGFLKHEADGVKMYTVPNDLKGGIYQYQKKNNLRLWARIAEDFQPDVIHIWGTEMAHSLCAIMAMPETPTVVYLQGLMAQICNHGYSGIDFITKLRYTSLRDIVENKGVHANSPFERKRMVIEEEVIKKAGNVILENDWAALNCKVINPQCRVFRSFLPINNYFANFDWDYDSCPPHSIFTVAGGYPIKGHHILFKALAFVKKTYPDVKLYIPGYNPLHDDTGMRRLFPHGYTKYTRQLIIKYNLSENIVFLGKLSLKEMAEWMSKSAVFVMPSAIENHSSTLIEAMMVGAPCVSSYVGGVSDYLKNDENGFLYRYDEPETLAGLIMSLFGDRKLSERLGMKAKTETRRVRLSIKVADDFINTYQIISNK